MSAYYEKDLVQAAEAGIQAPSFNNSQPWLFRLRDGAIEVHVDPGRRLRYLDERGWAARLACGAATYNARLALAAAGRPASVTLHPDPDDRDLVARLTPGPPRPPTYAERDLHAAIPRRHSNRGPFWPAQVPTVTRVRLLDAARDEGAWLDLLVGMTALTAFSEIAQGADRVLRRDTAYQMQLAGWTHVNGARDGIPVTAGAPLPEPQDLLPQRFFNDRPRAPGRDYEPEPLVGILGVSGDQPIDHTAAGQALQRVLLTATDAGLDTSMISQPIEVPSAREQLRRSLGRTGWPQITIRFGYGTPGHSAPRRDVADVVEIDEDGGEA
ncbi:nitroreductase [Actinoplanes sp. TBRC 11911]|uniref:Acg family FMN-binding oxidoreductase n=1 Tax=Actinoplanes sp. TBRC 11911 TaxID=2729386 RepID=UPI00145F24C1|nr:nitroreductase [Actinoplanes sp. TBRC 11911]NMO57273.1 nitroreductase [Actinoplanes sp. TBRC 11911]